MNKVDFDPNRFEQDSYGNLTPIKVAQPLLTDDNLPDVAQDAAIMSEFGLLGLPTSKEDTALGLYP